MDAEAYFESSTVPTARPIALPEAVREAREAASGLAGFGLAYSVVMGLIGTDEAAGSAALQFGCSWLLALTVCWFGRGPLARRVAIGLAVLQAVAVLRVHVEAVPDLAGVVVVLFTLGASVTIVHQLWQPEAKAWFDIRVTVVER